MNPGKLNKRIEFIYKGHGEDEDGYPIENWISFRKCWANIRGLKGREFYEAAAVQAQDDKVFTCRYFKGLTSRMHIKYKDKKYNIKSINNLDERNEFYVIHAKEVSTSE